MRQVNVPGFFRRFLPTIVSAVLVAAGSAAARGQVVLTVEDKSFTPPIFTSITSSLDVYFTVASGTPDLAAYAIRIDMAPSGPTTGSVRFVSPFARQPAALPDTGYHLTYADFCRLVDDVEYGGPVEPLLRLVPDRGHPRRGLADAVDAVVGVACTLFVLGFLAVLIRDFTSN